MIVLIVETTLNISSTNIQVLFTLEKTSSDLYSCGEQLNVDFFAGLLS